MQEKTKRTLNKLKLGQAIKLAKLVDAEYASSAMTDREFADLATARLGFTITGSSIANSRKEQEIPANHISVKAKAAAAQHGELEALKKRVDQLETMVLEMAEQLKKQ